MDNVISIKPNIIIPNKENVNYEKLVKNAHEYIDKINWERIVIMGMDKQDFINYWWENSTTEQTIYLMERHKHNMMKYIDEANE